MKKNIIYTLAIITVTFFLTGVSYSQSGSSDKSGFPKLNGKHFITNSFLKNPFVNTRLASNLGFASSLETEIPLLELRDTVINKTVIADITYVNGIFEFQYAIKDWAAIWLNMSGIARLGTNTVSIFATGVTAATTFETGMLFKIKEFKKSLISTAFSINNSSSTAINIFPFIKSLVDTTYTNPTNQLLNSLTPLSGSLDLRFAYSPGSEWSILSYIEGGYGENVKVDETTNNFFYVLGATCAYNFNEKDNFPLSVGAGFKLASNSPTLQYTKKLTQYYMLQLAYTGQKDFLLGLETNYLTIPTNFEDVTIKLSSFNFSWAYYF